MKSNAITTKTFEALGLILEEFHLQAALRQYREVGEYKAATQLEKAFARVATWHEREQRTGMRASRTNGGEQNDERHSRHGTAR